MTAEEMLAMRGVARNAWSEDSYPYYCGKKGHSGQRATGIALGAVGVGLAVLGIPLALVAAKAFASKAEAMANGNSQMIGETNNLVRTVAAGLQMESQNRERAIQIEHSERVQSNPTVQSYIDLAAGAGAYSGSNSASDAQAAATLAANGYMSNPAVENFSFVRTIPYSQPQPCCGGCNG